MRTSRCSCQGPVGIVTVPVGGFVEGILDIVHEVQHCESKLSGRSVDNHVEQLFCFSGPSLLRTFRSGAVNKESNN